MEDGDLKPSPIPIRLALEKLGVNPHEALMLGDTVDDIVAASKAKVVSCGVMTPQAYAQFIDAQAETGYISSLKAAGATRILKPGVAELLDVIPKNAKFASLKRMATVSRKTKETSIDAEVYIDGTGKSEVDHVSNRS